MDKIKGYRIGLRTTSDIEDGKQLSEPYYVIFVEYEDGSVWAEYDADTLEDAHEYIEKRMMKPVADKYKKLIEDELFKATPNEAIGFCEELKTYLKEVIEQTDINRE